MQIEKCYLTDINEILRGRASICGGALRSYLEDVLPRDIDIFMHSDSIEEYEAVCLDLTEAYKGLEEDYIEIRTALIEAGNYYAYELLKTEIGVDITVITPQVLYGRNCFGRMQDVVSEIDLDICRLGLTEHNEIYCADNFNTTFNNIQNKNMILKTQRPEEEAERTAKRLAKYASYGYTLIEEK